MHSRALWRLQGLSIDLTAPNNEYMLNLPVSFELSEAVHRRCDALRDMGTLQVMPALLHDTADHSALNPSHSHNSIGKSIDYQQSSNE